MVRYGISGVVNRCTALVGIQHKYRRDMSMILIHYAAA